MKLVLFLFITNSFKGAQKVLLSFYFGMLTVPINQEKTTFFVFFFPLTDHFEPHEGEGHFRKFSTEQAARKETTSIKTVEKEGEELMRKQLSAPFL